MRIYLDNCCYGRPYDEQSSQQIIAETQSMRLIRKKIENGKLELATSFMLHYEINQRKDVDKKNNIDKFIKTYRTLYVGIEHIARLDILASKIMATGIKTQDSYHVASAILADCDYFLSTDKRLVKYKSSEIVLMNPVDFVKVIGVDDDV